LDVQPKGIVIQVDSVELGKVEDGGEQRRDGVRDLAQESAGEDIGEVCDLEK
jgi:hypothetical protein